jgi:hypothetical protein
MKASEARKLSEVNGNKSPLQQILEQVKKQVELGRNNLYVYNLDKGIKKELTKLGYVIIPGHETGNETADQIIW